MIFGFLAGIILAAVYLLFYRWAARSKKMELPEKWMLVAVRIHWVALTLSLLSWWLYSEWQYVAFGFWFPRIAVIAMLITGTLVYPFYHAGWKNKAARIYFMLFSWWPFLAALLLLVPMLGLVIVLSVVANLTGTGDVLYEDKHVVVRTVFTGVLDNGDTEVWQKKGVLYQRVANDTYDYGQVQDVKVTYKDRKALVILFEEDDNNMVTLDTVEVPVQMKNENR